MLSTTLAAVAFSGLLAPGASGALPSWQTNYSTAMTAAVAQQKPMAVFIGRGEAGAGKLVNDGQFPSKAGEVLSASYVSVYVDTDTPAGKALAGEFGISEGLVISTKGAKLQAVRHTGTLTASQLTEYLVRYTDTMTVAHTAAYGGGGVSTCGPGGCSGGGYAGGSCYGGSCSGGYRGCSTGSCGSSCGGGRSCGGGGCGGGRRGGRCR
jgi:hypothetical protein